MRDHNNIYNIMGKLSALTPVEQPKQEAKAIYESVEAKGSVLEGVKKVQSRLEAKLAEHKMEEETCDECGMYESSCECDHEHTNEERETLKTKTGTIYKGGKYGTEFDVGDDGEKKKKPKAKDGEKQGRGRPKKEKPAEYTGPKGDIFGRTTGTAPKGKRGTVVKGKANQDTVDEMIDIDTLNQLASHPMAGPIAAAGGAAIGGALGKGIKKTVDYFSKRGEKKAQAKQQPGMAEEVTVDKLEKSYTKHMDRAAQGGGDKERKRAVKTLYVGGADKAEKAYDQYHQKKYGNTPNRDEMVAEKAPKGWEGTVKAMKKHKEIDNPYALTNYMKNKGMKSHVKESAVKTSNALMESVNFRKMMDEADMTADEMLEAINSDIQAYKSTGDMTNRLRDFMHLHNHMKKVEEEQQTALVPQMPSGQDILPQQSTMGKIGSTIKKAFTGPDDAELLARLQQDSQPTVDEELNELAQLAGITEGKTSPKADKDYDKDGEIESEKDEVIGSRRKAAGLDESSSLENFAKLAGVFQEGKDYGDTSYNEPPQYDNSPDECVQGVEVQTQGGDGEVAGKEKAMNATKPTWKNADNALAETKDMIKPAKDFNFVQEMGRDLMKAYQGIKTK